MCGNGLGLVFLAFLFLFVKTPYQRVVAVELLILANRKPAAHFVSLKHITGKKITDVKLRRLACMAVFESVSKT